MEEELSIKTIALRKYLHSHPDKMINIIFDINSDVVDKFFTALYDKMEHTSISDL